MRRSDEHDVPLHPSKSTDIVIGRDRFCAADPQENGREANG
jgi:hypothetical protein